uniref:Uncharacterized protein n=1 Tax=Anas zonorhyncha TaxID=75864 RepID=A0A8B9UTJ5_9AVES
SSSGKMSPRAAIKANSSLGSTPAWITWRRRMIIYTPAWSSSSRASSRTWKRGSACRGMGAEPCLYILTGVLCEHSGLRLCNRVRMAWSQHSEASLTVLLL